MCHCCGGGCPDCNYTGSSSNPPQNLHASFDYEGYDGYEGYEPPKKKTEKEELEEILTAIYDWIDKNPNRDKQDDILKGLLNKYKILTGKDKPSFL